MIYLMNSAMMPQAGKYECKKLTRNQFVDYLQDAFARDNLISFIGYPQNATLIKMWSGIEIELNRKQLTKLQARDQMLVMKLTYRMNPNEKGRQVSEDDFEFFIARYDG